MNRKKFYLSLAFLSEEIAYELIDLIDNLSLQDSLKFESNFGEFSEQHLRDDMHDHYTLSVETIYDEVVNENEEEFTLTSPYKVLTLNKVTNQLNFKDYNFDDYLSCLFNDNKQIEKFVFNSLKKFIQYDDWQIKLNYLFGSNEYISKKLTKSFIEYINKYTFKTHLKNFY